MQSFMWFHDHYMHHTGANVYKGMVGLYPIYDPLLDPGDERLGLRLPGVPNPSTGRTDYDLPFVFYDVGSTMASTATATRTTAAAKRTRSGGATTSSATSRTTGSSATSSPPTARPIPCSR